MHSLFLPPKALCECGFGNGIGVGMWLDLAMFRVGLFWVVKNAVVVGWLGLVIATSGCGFGMGLFWVVFLVVVVIVGWLW